MDEKRIRCELLTFSRSLEQIKLQMLHFQIQWIRKMVDTRPVCNALIHAGCFYADKEKSKVIQLLNVFHL